MPRIFLTDASGYSFFIAELRLALPVPMICRWFSWPGFITSRSAGLAALITAPMVIPSASSYGRSFALCTAISALWSDKAASISRTNRPLPPISLSAFEVFISPLVDIISLSEFTPTFFSCVSTISTCASESILPRDAITMSLIKSSYIISAAIVSISTSATLSSSSSDNALL